MSYVVAGYVVPGYVVGDGEATSPGHGAATKARVFMVELDVVRTIKLTNEVLRFASHSFVTRSNDTPANTFISGRINRGLTVGRRLNEAEDGQFGPLIKSRFGEIELNNVDGELDNLIDDFYIDGREIRVYIGAMETDEHGRERVQPFAFFELVYRARSGVWEAEHDVLRLKIEDMGKQLQEPLQTVTYAGTGGYEGIGDLTGRTRPIVVGECFNVPAQLIDPAHLIYEVHHGPVEIMRTVRDAGIPVPAEGGGIGGTPSNDYADYDALVAASVTVGTWTQCKAQGLIRLETPPAGRVTAHVSMEDDVNETLHGEAIKELLLQYSPLTLSDLEADSFDELDAAQAAAMGVNFPAGDQSTIEEAVARVAFAVGAFVGQDRSGLYRVQRLEGPSGTPDWVFGENDIIRIEREPLPYGIPWRRWGVAWIRNWTVQEDLASGVDPNLRNFLESEARWAFAENTFIAAVHSTSATAPLRQSLFMHRSDATILAQNAAASEAARLLALYSLGRAVYRVTVKTALFEMKLGEVVQIIYPRWNLSGGRQLVVVEVDDNADAGETEMRLFG